GIEIRGSIKKTCGIYISRSIHADGISFDTTKSPNGFCPKEISGSIQFLYKNVAIPCRGQVICSRAGVKIHGSPEISSGIHISRGVYADRLTIVITFSSESFCPEKISGSAHLLHKNVVTSC